MHGHEGFGLAELVVRVLSLQLLLLSKHQVIVFIALCAYCPHVDETRSLYIEGGGGGMVSGRLYCEEAGRNT